MPVNRHVAKPIHTHPELVDELVAELNSPRPQGGVGIPDIHETEQTFGDRISVKVIWDKWRDVNQAERGPIILDAYRSAKGERMMVTITLALGFTVEENRRWLARTAQEEQDDA